MTAPTGMAVDVPAAMQELLDLLTAAGIRATQDEAQLNPPCVLVRRPTLQWRFSGTCQSATWSVLAVAENVDRQIALTQLAGLLQETSDAIGRRFSSARATTLAAPGGDDARLEAYEMTWTTTF